MEVNYTLIANFNVENISFNAIRENEVLRNFPNLQ